MHEQDKRSIEGPTPEDLARVIRALREDREKKDRDRLKQLGEQLNALQLRVDHIGMDLSVLTEKIESGLGQAGDSGQVIHIDIDHSVGSEDAMLMDYLRNSVVVKERPDVSFDDVGGQESAVLAMKTLALKLKFPDVFKRWGVKPPRGILLHGQPGTGKTLLAKALAHESNAGFVNANLSNLKGHWHGQSEKLHDFLFSVAREEAVKHEGICIVFIDEVEAVARMRDRVEWAIDNRLFSLLLQGIDGFVENKDVSIVVVAATNRLDMIDPAFLSRMSDRIEMPLPDVKGRIKILDIHFKLAEKFAGRSLVTPETNFGKAAELLIDYSGRDISDFVQKFLTRKALKDVYERPQIFLVSDDELLSALMSDRTKAVAKQ